MNSEITKDHIERVSEVELHREYQELGDYLRQAIRDKGLTIQQAASSSQGWHLDSLGRFLRGKHPPPRALQGRRFADQDPRYPALAALLGLDESAFVERVKRLQTLADAPRGVPSEFESDSEGDGSKDAPKAEGDSLSLAIEQIFSSRADEAMKDLDDTGATIRLNCMETLVRFASTIPVALDKYFDPWAQNLSVVVSHSPDIANRVQPAIQQLGGARQRPGGALGSIHIGLARDLKAIYPELRDAGASATVLRSMRVILGLAEFSSDDFDVISATLVESLDALEIDPNHPTSVEVNRLIRPFERLQNRNRKQA